MQEVKKIVSKDYPEIILRAIPGHFVTPSSHVNYYIDMTMLKSRRSEATAVGVAIGDMYSSNTIVDTIVCMEHCEVVGAYLAQELAKVGVLSMNAHKTIYIVSPEFDMTGQIIFRENIVPMIKEKNVLILSATATTGKTVGRAYEAIQYYGGKISGVSAIFSAANKIGDIPIKALFSTADIPDYKTYSPSQCALCKEGVPIDAMANGYGYSRI